MAHSKEQADYPFAVISAWRKRVDLSQSKFAALMGISRDHVAKLEQEQRVFTKTMQLACERLSVQIAAQMRDLNLLLPAVFEDCLNCGLLGVALEKNMKK